MKALDLRKVGLAVAAPVLAILVAFVVTSIVLLAAKDPVGAVWTQLLTPPKPRLVVAIINSAAVYYLSAIAVAVGFRMNLFNIGVDGQYRVAAFAGQGWLPGPLNILVSLVIAMVAGAFWAGIAGWLKVTRGVSEVISTIMLNAIATAMVSYLLSKVAKSTSGSNVTNTKTIPADSQLGGFGLIPGTPNKIYTLIL